MKIDEVATVDVEVKSVVWVVKSPTDIAHGVANTSGDLISVSIYSYGVLHSFHDNAWYLVEWANRLGLKAVVREVTETVSI